MFKTLSRQLSFSRFGFSGLIGVTLRTAFATALVSSGISIVAPASAQACTCDPKPDIEQALEQSSVVFVGQVKSKVENPLKKEQWEVKFSVSRKLKGFEEVPGNQVLIYTPKDHEYCGYKFQDGLDYVVYATGNPAHLQTTSCMRTEILDKVLTDVHKLIRLTGKVETKTK